jgi:hypothetical protein
MRFDYLQMAYVPSKGPTNSACMRTMVTAALQWQYLQMELILWIRLIV